MVGGGFSELISRRPKARASAPRQLPGEIAKSKEFDLISNPKECETGRMSFCCPDPSKNRSIGAQARVTARQIRNNVDLCCYTETDQYGAMHADQIAWPRPRNAIPIATAEKSNAATRGAKN